MRSLSLVIVFATVTLASINVSHSGQNWIELFGEASVEKPHSIQQTADGGYIVAGDSFFADDGIRIYKLDGDGVIMWEKLYGGSARSIQQTTDGGYIVAGTSQTSDGAGNGDVYILKLDETGNITWQKTYGGADYDGAKSIQQTTDGGYIVAGNTKSFGAGFGDMWVLKISSNGDISWENTYGGTSPDDANSIQQTIDGGYIVVGTSWSFGAGVKDLWILKLDPTGIVTWQKTYGGSQEEEGYSIRQTSDGGYIVAGDARPVGFTNRAFWVIKIDDSGVPVWQKTYGGGGSSARSVQQTTDGGYILAGRSPYGNVYDLWVLKLNGSGILSWGKKFSNGVSENSCSIQQTSDAGYIVAGDAYFRVDNINEKRNRIMKLDALGEVPNCPLIENLIPDVFDTSVTDQTSNAFVEPSTATITDTDIIPNDTSAELFVACCDSSDDSDCDGIVDTYDNCPLTYNHWQKDADNDGVGDVCDNCSSVINPDQTNSDSDEFGNACDNCPYITNPNQSDMDNDEIGDVCDSDRDGDGIANGDDNCPDIYNPDQNDRDVDGIGDLCDALIKRGILEPFDFSICGEDETHILIDPCNELSGVFLKINDPDPSHLYEYLEVEGFTHGILCTIIDVERITLLGDPHLDKDVDGIEDACDNCPDEYNPDQEDTYPPDGNGIGDACECEGNFDCDKDIDGGDAAHFKMNFGRSLFSDPCENENPCKGDFDCDCDVDGTDAAKFKEDFGRSPFHMPCAETFCHEGEWCVYQ